MLTLYCTPHTCALASHIALEDVVMGDTYTICDPYLFTLAQWLEADGVDPARLPKIQDHARRMAERPAVRKAIADELGGA